MSIEQFVPLDHPLRAIRPLIDKQAIRRECRGLYCPTGRASIPPEQLFLALVGGYLLGIASERKLVMELQCNMALRWFVGFGLEEQPWDANKTAKAPRTKASTKGTRINFHETQLPYFVVIWLVIPGALLLLVAAYLGYARYLLSPRGKDVQSLENAIPTSVSRSEAPPSIHSKMVLRRWLFWQ